MMQNFLMGGIILSPLVAELAVSVVLTALISVLLMRLGFYRLVLHRPLIELALFCIILGGIVALTEADRPTHGMPMPVNTRAAQ